MNLTFPLATLLAFLVTAPMQSAFGQALASASNRPFRVQDSIELTRILDPAKSPFSGGLVYARGVAGVTSPDGRHTAVLLTKGDVAKNANIYMLVVLRIAHYLIIQPLVKWRAWSLSRASRESLK